MEIRELYRDEVANLVQAGRDSLGARSPSQIQLRALRDNPRAFLPVAVAGTEIVGIALAELCEDARKRVGAVRFVASFVGEHTVDRAVRLALLRRLESQFTSLNVDEIEVLVDRDLDFLSALERRGYRPDSRSDNAAPGGEPARLVKPLHAAVSRWARRSRRFPTQRGVVQ
jgi:hypothetical protein